MTEVARRKNGLQLSKRRDNRAFMSWTACEPLSSLALSVEPALVLSPDGAHMLWANPAGANRLGTQDLETLLSEEFPQGFALRKQIRHLFTWLDGNNEQIQRLRLGRSASTPLEVVNVRKLRNVEGTAGVLLRPIAKADPQEFQSRADTLADWLGSGHHYAALFSTNGDVIASSGAFHELRYAAQTLQNLLEEAEDSAFPVSQQVKVRSGTRHLVTALRLPGEDDDVFLLLVDAADTPLQASVEEVLPDELAGKMRTVRQDQSGRMAALDLQVPIPANDANPPQPKTRDDKPTLSVEDKSADTELMRFVWRMDDSFKFTFVSPEFQTLVGLRGAMEGRTWQDLAGDFQLDPEGEVQNAITSKDLWGGKHISWALPKRKKIARIELSAMPVTGVDKRFMGYRGFGACQLESEDARLDEASDQDSQIEKPLNPTNDADDAVADVFETDLAEASTFDPLMQEQTISNADDLLSEAKETPAIVDTRVSTSTPIEQTSTPSQIIGLTPEERRAFEEIGKSLGKQSVTQSAAKPDTVETTSEATIKSTPKPAVQSETVSRQDRDAAQRAGDDTQSAFRTMLDRVDTGVLVVRDDQLLFANLSLAKMVGYKDAQAYLSSNAASPFGGFSLDRVDDDGLMQLTGKDESTHRVRATIGKIDWNGEAASLLTVHPIIQSQPMTAPNVGVGDRVWSADELLAILNTATEGVLMIDVEGKILALNHGAEALFDEEQSNLVGRDITTLLALESHKPARDYLAGITGAGVASVLNDGREVIGQTAKGGFMPLFMTMGRVGEESPEEMSDMRLCVVLRDITQWKRAEDDLIAARLNAEKANTAKSDFLAKISHEIRTPLNAILGFSEVMLEERFGPVGNSRYKDYINDIHTSGAHVINLVNDMLDISKIEAGQLDLSFSAVDLVAVLKECVALMQPQANEGRVIIRTSFSDDLPRVVADAKTLRQIALNLLSNSIKFTAEGGQVIVSAVVEKDGSLIIRVRDTGVGMNEADLAKAMEPFRQVEQTDPATGLGRKNTASSGTGLGLPLTKALVEANRAQFLIESTPSKGTLIRVVFPNTRVLAE